MIIVRAYGLLAIALFLFSLLNLILELRFSWFYGMRLVTLSVVNMLICLFLIRLHQKFSK